MSYLSVKDIDLAGKRLLVRVDFNVPLDDQGHITHDVRIKAAIPTIEYALAQNASVILLSHMGRPTEGEFDERYSLAKVADSLAGLMSRQVHFVEDFQAKSFFELGQVYLLENVRFFKGEKSCSSTLSATLAAQGDIFVMDAFSVAHRAQASTVGVAQNSESVCAGLALCGELEALSKVLGNPQRPLVAIVGGSKVSTKFKVLDKLLEKVDTLILGGGMANTFLKAQGHDIKDSLYEPDWCSKAIELISKAQQLGKNLILPSDVVCAKQLDNPQTNVYSISNLDEGQKILDIGPETIEQIEPYIAQAKTIVWNGPMGVFEVEAFSNGTMALARQVADSSAFCVAGGGDTLAAIELSGIGGQIGYQSTAGGAFLEYLEGAKLPGLEILKS